MEEMKSAYKIDFGEMGFEDVDWIGLPQDRVKWQAFMYMVMNLWVL
jgi:hypothetical protein